MSGGCHRFTIDGSDELEAHLARSCGKVLKSVRAIIPARTLQAVLLGGGYGRGEGGVLCEQSAQYPYNDLEFYVFVRGDLHRANRRFAKSLHLAGAHLKTTASVDVEFKVSSFPKVRRTRTNMFFYDLVSGHRWLLGGEELLAGCEHHADGSRIPLHEAARLLMNRCTGLLFAADLLAQPVFDAEAADFVGRNLAKAQLALGDVVLTTQRQYHWSCLERHSRLRQLLTKSSWGWAQAVLEAHGQGVEFKLHPVRTQADRGALRAQHAAMKQLAGELWLWLEAQRLQRNHSSLTEYALDPVNKCPEEPLWKNWLINIRAFGPKVLLDRGATRYPRERLFNSLALLLFEPDGRRQEHLFFLQRALKTRASSFAELLRSYRTLWAQFN